MRFLNNKQIKDKISTKNLLNNINFLSVNQINVQIKITEVWKSPNLTQYPINFNKAIINNSREGLRSGASGKLNEVSGSEKLKSSYINDGAKAWNLTPAVIKNCKSLFSAKVEIKKIVKTLPV